MKLSESQKEALNEKFQKQFDAGFDVAYGSVRTERGRTFFRRFKDKSWIDEVPWAGY